MSKDNIRKEALRCRGNMDVSDENPDEMCEILFENFDIGDESNVALYWPKGKELSTFPIMDKLDKFLLPVVGKTRNMKFALFQGEDRLVKAKYDIYQPVEDNDTIYTIPDIIIVPMLAFDRKGTRLGYGGGYYDCTIDILRSEHKDLKIIGIAYSKQACLFSLPVEDHDQKMDYIVTPKEIISFR